MHSEQPLTDSFWGSDFPNGNVGNTDDCGLIFVESIYSFWQDSDCLVTAVDHQSVAPICQHDTDESATSTTPITTTTTEAPATTTVTTTTTEAPATTTVTRTTTGNSCPSGWQEFEGHCYLYVANWVTWTEAENDCISKGSHLASIHSEDENTFILNLPSRPISKWIGGTDAAIEVSLQFMYNVHTPTYTSMYTYCINSRFPQLRAIVKIRFCNCPTYLIKIHKTFDRHRRCDF